jgi:hypothetical protein
LVIGALRALRLCRGLPKFPKKSLVASLVFNELIDPDRAHRKPSKLLKTEKS